MENDESKQSKPIGVFQELTPEEQAEFRKWCQSDEAAKLFNEARKEVEKESEDFINRTTISYEQLHRPFYTPER